MSESATYKYEQLGPTPLVRDALVATTFEVNRALDPGVERLLLMDLGNPRYTI